MKKNILTACMLCGTLSLTAQTASSGLNIIPTPLETKITEGAFQFNPLTTQVAAKGKEAKETTDFFKSKMRPDSSSNLARHLQKIPLLL